MILVFYLDQFQLWEIDDANIVIELLTSNDDLKIEKILES